MSGFCNYLRHGLTRHRDFFFIYCPPLFAWFAKEFSIFKLIYNTFCVWNNLALKIKSAASTAKGNHSAVPQLYDGIMEQRL